MSSISALDIDRLMGPAPKPTGRSHSAPSAGLVDEQPQDDPLGDSGDDAYRPFPADALPSPLREFVEAGAEAIGCDAGYLGLAVLVGAASAIGGSRRIKLKNSWSEPAILWGVLIGESGSSKSPALELALRPIRRRQHRAMLDYRDRLQQYEADSESFERSRKGNKGEASSPPVPPIADRCVADDLTCEALARLLQENPRGLLVARDELGAWFGSFDKYSAGGKGADAARWIEVYGARSLTVDRRTSGTLYVRSALVSVIGGTQPATLARALGREHRDSGLAARLLMANPPRRQRVWTEADIDPAIETEMDRVFANLFRLDPALDDCGEPTPRMLVLAPEAKAMWLTFFEAHNAELAQLSGDLAAVWSKLEAAAARLALVVHCVRVSAGDPDAYEQVVDRSSMEAGITLARWFGHEARRAYRSFDASPEHRERRGLIETIVRHGGAVSARELMRTSSQYATAQDAEAALEALAASGVGAWVTEHPPGGKGRPARRLRLSVNVDRSALLGSGSNGPGFAEVA